MPSGRFLRVHNHPTMLAALRARQGPCAHSTRDEVGSQCRGCEPGRGAGGRAANRSQVSQVPAQHPQSFELWAFVQASLHGGQRLPRKAVGPLRTHALSPTLCESTVCQIFTYTAFPLHFKEDTEVQRIKLTWPNFHSTKSQSCDLNPGL